MKKLFYSLVTFLLLLPCLAICQDTIPPNTVGTLSLVDSSTVPTSPVEFGKALNINSLAKYFGVDTTLFLIFVGLIIFGTEICRRNIKYQGQYVFRNNLSFVLPFIVGVFIAFISPTGFSTILSIRFGLQGGLSAMIIHYLSSFIHSERT